jgi:hypothetical protein
MTVSRTSNTMPRLVVEHAVTHDMEDGQPLPPYYGGAVWHVVRRLPGGSRLWRSISIRASAPPPAPRDLRGGKPKQAEEPTP